MTTKVHLIWAILTTVFAIVIISLFAFCPTISKMAAILWVIIAIMWTWHSFAWAKRYDALNKQFHEYLGGK